MLKTLLLYTNPPPPNATVNSPLFVPHCDLRLRSRFQVYANLAWPSDRNYYFTEYANAAFQSVDSSRGAQPLS